MLNFLNINEEDNIVAQDPRSNKIRSTQINVELKDLMRKLESTEALYSNTSIEIRALQDDIANLNNSLNNMKITYKRNKEALEQSKKTSPSDVDEIIRQEREMEQSKEEIKEIKELISFWTPADFDKFDKRQAEYAEKIDLIKQDIAARNQELIQIQEKPTDLNSDHKVDMSPLSYSSRFYSVNPSKQNREEEKANILVATTTLR